MSRFCLHAWVLLLLCLMPEPFGHAIWQLRGKAPQKGRRVPMSDVPAQSTQLFRLVLDFLVRDTVLEDAA